MGRPLHTTYRMTFGATRKACDRGHASTAQEDVFEAIFPLPSTLAPSETQS